MSVNKVILIGNLGQDPDFKYTPNGSAVCTFSIATTEEWKDKNGSKQSKTEWHNIVVWGKPAENANQYLSKGSQVYIEGRLETRSWDDKDGNKRYKTEINATTVQYLSKKEKSHENTPAPKESSSSSQSEFASDDIPF